MIGRFRALAFTATTVVVVAIAVLASSAPALAQTVPIDVGGRRVMVPMPEGWCPYPEDLQKQSKAMYEELSPENVALLIFGDCAQLRRMVRAASGIRMNNVLPGFVDSLPEKPERKARIPMGRYARVEEIADAVAFLASDKASYITGQNIRVDGGITRAL